MSEGPIREAGETARTIVDVFRNQPVMLALCLIIFGMVGFIYYSQSSLNAERRFDRGMEYQYRHDIADLLSRCNLPPLPDKR